jgi:hypothetical protein
MKCGVIGSDNFALWAGAATSTGFDTITFSPSYGQIIAYDVQNLTTTVDGSCVHASGGSPVLNITTANPNDLIIAKFGESSGSGGAISIASPWTDSGTLHNGWNDLDTAYRVGATATTYTATWTTYTGGDANNIAFEPMTTPVSGVQGQSYYQTSTSPYTHWIYDSGTWHQVQ